MKNKPGGAENGKGGGRVEREGAKTGGRKASRRPVAAGHAG